MDRAEIVRQYTDEIAHLAIMGTFCRETVSAALQCALTEFHIMITKQQVDILNEALASLERGRE